MNVRFRASFKKDLKRIKDKKLLAMLNQVIEAVKCADALGEINHLQKLKGHGDFYRIRVGDYRIGLRRSGDDAVFVRFLHRKEIYRFFPDTNR